MTLRHVAGDAATKPRVLLAYQGAADAGAVKSLLALAAFWPPWGGGSQNCQSAGIRTESAYPLSYHGGSRMARGFQPPTYTGFPIT